MDDFNVSALHESKNEWGSRLVTILTPLIIDGYKSILEESIKLCKENREADKYLMTFQNLWLVTLMSFLLLKVIQ